MKRKLLSFVVAIVVIMSYSILTFADSEYLDDNQFSGLQTLELSDDFCSLTEKEKAKEISIIEAFISDVESEMEIEDGAIVPDSIDFDVLEEEYGEDLTKMAEDSIECVNEAVEDGEMAVLGDGSVVEGEDDYLMPQEAKYNKDTVTKYWWGVKQYMSYNTAKTFSKKFNNAYLYLGTTSIFVGCTAPIAGIVIGCAGSYYDIVARAVDRKNKPNIGVKMKVYFSTAYVVRSQNESW